VTRLLTALAVAGVLGTAALSGAVLVFAERARNAERRADHAEAQHNVCGCKLVGGDDDAVMGFDTFTVGEARATPGQMDSMLIPARTVCGPMRLRAWLGGDGP
jgi:hypothetical protein